MIRDARQGVIYDGLPGDLAKHSIELRTREVAFIFEIDFALDQFRVASSALDSLPSPFLSACGCNSRICFSKGLLAAINGDEYVTPANMSAVTRIRLFRFMVSHFLPGRECVVILFQGKLNSGVGA